MANIKEYLYKIRTAIFGREVRDSLADGLEAVNVETKEATALAEETEARQTVLENTWNNVVGELTEDAEVVNAREDTEGTVHPTLKVRLDNDRVEVSEKLAETNKLITDIEVLVREFGAVGDSTDETDKIQNAIDFAANVNGRVRFEYGKTYMIDAEKELILRNNTTIDLTGAKLKAIPNENTHYTILRIHDVENVNVINAHLEGDRNEKSDAIEGEWGHGVRISNSKNINFHSLTVENCRGDGIYIGDIDTDNTRTAEQLNFYGTTYVSNCKRNGISVIRAKNGYVENLVVEDITGALPSAAIDFEPNYEHETIENFKIASLTAIRCDKSVLFVFNSSKFTIDIENIISIDCRNGSLAFHGYVQSDNAGYINIGNVYNNKLIGRPPVVISDWYVGKNPIITINNYQIDKWDMSSPDVDATYYAYVLSRISEMDSAWLKNGGITINNIHVNQLTNYRGVVLFYANIIDNSMVIPNGLKASDIRIGVSQNTNVPYTSTFTSELPVDLATCLAPSLHTVRAISTAEGNADANTFIDKSLGGRLHLFNYNTAREGSINYPSGSTYGWIFELVSSNYGSVQLGVSLFDHTMYIRRIDQNNNASAWHKFLMESTE